jgi:hypothetical protein
MSKTGLSVTAKPSKFPHKWLWLFPVLGLFVFGTIFRDPSYVIVFRISFIFYILCFTYHLWERIQDDVTEITPGRAIGFLFIPFFNIAWLFKVWAGYASELNAFRERYGLPGRASGIITVTFTIAWLLWGLVSLTPLSPFGLITRFFSFIMTLTFVAHTGRLANDFDRERQTS